MELTLKPLLALATVGGLVGCETAPSSTQSQAPINPTSTTSVQTTARSGLPTEVACRTTNKGSFDAKAIARKGSIQVGNQTFGVSKDADGKMILTGNNGTYILSENGILTKPQGSFAFELYDCDVETAVAVVSGT